MVGIILDEQYVFTRQKYLHSLFSWLFSSMQPCAIVGNIVNVTTEYLHFSFGIDCSISKGISISSEHPAMAF